MGSSDEESLPNLDDEPDLPENPEQQPAAGGGGSGGGGGGGGTTEAEAEAGSGGEEGEGPKEGGGGGGGKGSGKGGKNGVTTMSPEELAAAKAALAAGEIPSLGSHKHPEGCKVACKYFTKNKGCKEGADCMRCHLCKWKRNRTRKKGGKGNGQGEGENQKQGENADDGEGGEGGRRNNREEQPNKRRRKATPSEEDTLDDKGNTVPIWLRKDGRRPADVPRPLANFAWPPAGGHPPAPGMPGMPGMPPMGHPYPYPPAGYPPAGRRM